MRLKRRRRRTGRLAFVPWDDAEFVDQCEVTCGTRRIALRRNVLCVVMSERRARARLGARFWRIQAWLDGEEGDEPPPGPFIHNHVPD